MNEITYLEIKEAIESAKKDPYNLVEKYWGRYNDAPPNWHPIEPNEFWSKFSMYGVGTVQTYKQIIERLPDMPYMQPNPGPVHLFIYSDGTGLGVHVSYDWDEPYNTRYNPHLYAFALCEHERIATLDTRRGWHEGYCKKCKMQMNYDSGD